MRDKDKPFVMYRRGSGNFTIVPRGVAGWSQFAVWLALLGVIVVWFADHVDVSSNDTAFYDGLALFGIGMIGWLIAGAWWMVAHAEVVDIAELMRDRQMAERKRRRRR